MARPTLPLDGEYTIKVKLLQTNLGSVRGLEYPQQLEISVDGARVHLVPMGGPADFAILPENAEEIAEALDARLVVRVPIAAGPHDVVATFVQRTDAQGGHRLQPFLRSNVDATDHTGLPAHRELHDHRSVRHDGVRRHAEPATGVQLPAGERRGRENLCATGSSPRWRAARTAGPFPRPTRRA